MSFELDPICASCYGPMRPVTVHHPNGVTRVWPLCPTCLTTRHLDLADTPPELAALDAAAERLGVARPRRHLRVVS